MNAGDNPHVALVRQILYEYGHADVPTDLIVTSVQQANGEIGLAVCRAIDLIFTGGVGGDIGDPMYEEPDYIDDGEDEDEDEDDGDGGGGGDDGDGGGGDGDGGDGGGEFVAHDALMVAHQEQEQDQIHMVQQALFRLPNGVTEPLPVIPQPPEQGFVLGGIPEVVPPWVAIAVYGQFRVRHQLRRRRSYDFKGVSQWLVQQRLINCDNEQLRNLHRRMVNMTQFLQQNPMSYIFGLVPSYAFEQTMREYARDMEHYIIAGVPATHPLFPAQPWP